MENIKNKKILIVDDEQEIRHMLEGFLRKEGFVRNIVVHVELKK